uniref:TPR_REGION domain-containing protein n=1 Tax=Anopheles dirus TaxID=7168 RepID=A0A182NPR7_9DIPT
MSRYIALVALLVAAVAAEAPYPASGWRPEGAQFRLPTEYGAPLLFVAAQPQRVAVQITRENVQFAGQQVAQEQSTTTAEPVTQTNEYIPPATTTTTEQPELDPLTVQGLPSDRNRDFQQRANLRQQPFNRQLPANFAQRPFFPVSGQLRALPAVQGSIFQQQQQQQQVQPQTQPQAVPAETYGPPEQEEVQPEEPVTTEQPHEVAQEESEDDYEHDAGRPVVAVANAFSGQYYILSPDNTLQRVVYSTMITDEDRQANGFSAQLKYSPVDPIRGPVYTYDEQGQLSYNMEEKQAKKVLTEQERLELADQLDKDLDSFISSLEQKRYTEGWPEDRWEEEMAKHPFFTKKAPEPGEQLSPLMEGLQQLKYDPQENTEQELADTYKEDGKFYMQHRKFRLAVLSYTEALKYKVADAAYKAILYNNRSAANYMLKNYRSSLQDALKAVELNADYDKARWRAAQCTSVLDRFDQCVELCDTILQRDPANAAAVDMRKSCLARKATAERDARKEARQERGKQQQWERLLAELKERKVKFEERYAPEDESKLVPRLAPLADFRVSCNEDGVLCWPAVICYPEFSTTDFQQMLFEDVKMQELLDHLFDVPLLCDTAKQYRADTVNVYYENRILGLAYLVDRSKTIRQILTEKTFLVYDGILTFYILVKGSKQEETFVTQKRIPIKREYY